MSGSENKMKKWKKQPWETLGLFLYQREQERKQTGCEIFNN